MFLLKGAGPALDLLRIGAAVPLLERLAKHLETFFLLCLTLWFPPLLSCSAPLKMKRRLPSSGTSTIFMLSQTASTPSFSWSDWGLLLFLSQHTLCLLVLLVSSLFCHSSPTVPLLPYQSSMRGVLDFLRSEPGCIFEQWNYFTRNPIIGVLHL